MFATTCIDCVPALPGRGFGLAVSTGRSAALSENVNRPLLLGGWGAVSTFKVPSKPSTVEVLPSNVASSSSTTVTVAFARGPIVTLPSEKFRSNVSFGSSTPSSIECSVIVFSVSPGANVSVPEAAS